MRITSVHADAFGVFDGLALERLSERVTVFYGANEAGKTTLMQFIRGVLYGYDDPRRRGYLDGHPPANAGGTLELVAPQGKIRVTRRPAGLDGRADAEGKSGAESAPRAASGDRRGYKHPADATADRLRVAGRDGTLLGDHVLRSILADVDEAIFNNVFAVGLREVQHLGSLSDTQAAVWLYSLASGLDRVSLVGVVRELEGARRRLLAPDDGNSLIPRLVRQREQLRGDIGRLEGNAARWAQLLGDQSRLKEQITKIEEDAGGLHRRQQAVQAATTVSDAWHERRRLDEELEGLALHDDVSADGLAQIDSIAARLVRWRTQRERYRHRREELRREHDALAVNENLWRQAPRIEALAEQQQWIASIEGQLGELSEEVELLRGQWRSEVERLGLKTSANSLRLEIKPRMQSALRSPARALAETKKRQSQLEKQSAASLEQAASLEDEIAVALASRKEQDLSDALENTGQQVAELRRRIELDERLERLKEKRDDSDAGTDAAPRQELLPVWWLVGLGGAFVLAVMLIFLGWMLSSTVTSALGWLLAIAGGCTAATRYVLRRTADQQVIDRRQHLKAVEKQIEEIEKQREEIDRRLGKGGGSLTARLESAQRELAALEELLPMDARRKSAAQEAAAADTRLTRAREEYQSARRSWRRTLTDLGLPENLSPRQVKRLMVRSRDVTDLGRRIERQEQELADRRRECEVVQERVAQLMAEVEIEPEQERTVERIRQLVAALEGERGRIEHRDGLRRQGRKLRRAIGRFERRSRTAQHRREDLLRAAGCRGEEDYRRQVAQVEHAQSLRRRRAELCREMARTIAAMSDEESVAAILEDPVHGDLAPLVEQIDREIADSQRRLKEAIAQHAQVAEQAKRLAEDIRLEERRMELSDVESRLAEAVRAWQVRSVVSLALEEMRREFEKHRQPQTLIEASEYLRKMTRGRYTRVWTPMGEEVLLVDGDDGRSWPAEQLSRGTREQLFLSLRLALVDQFARRGIELPLVLDDVLVNFDAARVRAAAEVLRDFAETGRQVLLFTCHEHIWRIFQSLDADVRRLPGQELAEAAVQYDEEEFEDEPLEEYVEEGEEAEEPTDLEPMPAEFEKDGEIEEEEEYEEEPEEEEEDYECVEDETGDEWEEDEQEEAGVEQALWEEEELRDEEAGEPWDDLWTPAEVDVNAGGKTNAMHRSDTHMQQSSGWQPETDPGVWSKAATRKEEP